MSRRRTRSRQERVADVVEREGISELSSQDAHEKDEKKPTLTRTPGDTPTKLRTPKSERGGLGIPLTRAHRDALNKLRVWKRKLDRMGIGYGAHADRGVKDFNMLVGMPFSITPQEFEQLRRRGSLYANMFHTANKLYAGSLSNPNIVTKLVEGGMTDKAVDFQRRLYDEKGGVRPPVFFRADMLSLDTTVELNIPGGGLGLMHAIDKVALRETTFGVGLAQGWARGLRQLTGKENPRVAFPLYNERVRTQTRYFGNLLDSLGIQARVYGKNLPDPSKIDVLVRFGMNYTVSQDGWDKMWDAYMEGGVEIEPPPASIYDTKVPELLAFHPETRTAFPTGVREIFPETWLVKPYATIRVSEGESEKDLPVDQIHTLSQKRRAYVIKYAGSKEELRAAGKGVFQLDGSKRGAERRIFNALVDYNEGNGAWIIQPRIREYYDITHLTEDGQLAEARMHARIMPYYLLLQDQPEVIGGSTLFSKKWKVHGQKDSVHCPIKVEDS